VRCSRLKQLDAKLPTLGLADVIPPAPAEPDDGLRLLNYGGSSVTLSAQQLHQCVLKTLEARGLGGAHVIAVCDEVIALDFAQPSPTDPSEPPLRVYRETDALNLRVLERMKQLDRPETEYPQTLEENLAESASDPTAAAHQDCCPDLTRTVLSMVLSGTPAGPGLGCSQLGKRQA